MRGFILVLLMSLTILWTGCAAAITYEGQVELGYKFLTEGKYDEAILTFNKAIDIDEKQAKAYIGLADTYSLRGDEQAIKDIGLVMKKAYEITNSLEIIDGYNRIINELISNGNIDSAVLLAKQAMEITGSSIFQPIVVTVENSEELNELRLLCETGDMTSVREFMHSESFTTLNELVGTSPIIYPLDSDKRGVKAIGVYPHGMLYYGKITEGMRNGQGWWLKVYPDDLEENIRDDYRLFYGTWSNDKPNGSGVLEHIVYYQTGEYEWDDRVIMTMKGNLVNGFWDGPVTDSGVTTYSEWSPDSQSVKGRGKSFTNHYHYSMGIAKIISTEYKESIEGNYYTVGVDDNATASAWRTDLNINDQEGIFGFTMN